MQKFTFQFKQFTITQQKSAQKVGTDGVLLGALAKGEQASTILDIGTGTGLIALMLAQRFSAHIDAVEIDYDAAMEATENSARSPWNDRIRIIHASIQDFTPDNNTTYQLIVSNPPFFQNSLKSDDRAKNLARHNDSLPLPELLESVNRLLSFDGTFQVIVPAESHSVFIAGALAVGLFCNEMIWIKPTPEKKPKRVVLTFNRAQNQLKESYLVIESGGRHHYSDEYKRLTKDFYLTF